MDIEDEILEIIINARIINFKNNKQINEYINIRELHSATLSKLIDEYELKGIILKDLLEQIMEEISEEINKNELLFKLELSDLNEKDINIINDLLIYKNHFNLKSFIEKYIENNKLNNLMLESMKKSVTGLFKIKHIKRNKGYIILEEIFTHQKYKVIDLTLSLLENKDLYLFTRIITHNKINFLTNITFAFNKNNKLIKKYIKRYKNVKMSPILKYLSLYNLYKNDKNKININTNYI